MSYEFSAWHSRKLATDFMAKVSGLIDQVEDPQRRPRIAVFLQAEGDSFPGDTVGGLAEHVLSYRLTIRPGSQAHALLSERFCGE
jgi:hypothetical protein